VNEVVRDRRLADAKLPRATVLAASKPVPLEQKGLTRRDAASGTITEAPTKSPLELFFVPFILAMLMYMQVMFGATPLMQGVLEEKGQRIAEVLLGSVRPFELMAGKFVGMVGVSLTIAAVYLGGGFAAARYYGYAEALTPSLLAWFVVFQVLAVFMYGAMFTAVGAACTDAKEAQSLLWPVTMLIILPMFLLVNVIREPNSPFAIATSLIPFATPILMVARQAVPPGVPWWQPALATVLMLAMTVACIYAAGRIFRVGLLMQGKGAKLADLARWVIRG
jgi:ABC-2 type transport system permease protein